MNHGYKLKAAMAARIDAAADKMPARAPAQDPTPKVGPGRPAAERAEAVLRGMTLEEKIDMLGGIDSMGIRGVERLGLPTVWCSDASSGVRCFGPGTAFPAFVAMTATWNRDAMRRVGEAIAEECRALGVAVLLGPGVNIARVPTCGRNFEYMGEDPLLAAEMVVPFIEGVQGRGVAATVKHFACNNSDHDRHRMNAIVDERTLREIYLPAFRAAVQKANVRCVMNSYNPVNGTYASENPSLLRDILKTEWGFQGFVMSDWNSVYSTRGPLEAGLDLEMPRGIFYCREQILPMVRAGAVPEALIDDKIRRILTTLFDLGVYDRGAHDPRHRVGGEAHIAASLEAAREAIVLLKNENDMLPLTPASVRRIAVLGANGRSTPAGGGGAAYVRPTGPVSIEQGLREAFAPAEVVWVPDRRGRIAAAGAAELRRADAVVVCAGFDHVLESEHYDRRWRLPAGQDRLIRRAASLNANVVVVLTSGGDVETASWIGSAKAVLHTFYLGSIAGRAIADVLAGKANPSGKLPFTMAKRWRDHPATASYVRVPDRTSKRQMEGPKPRTLVGKVPAAQLEMMRREQRPVRYEEGIFVGYRGFDARSVEPQFPFGHGLSYTSFALSGARVSSRRVARGQAFAVSVTVRNTGKREGSEVVQVYVSDNQASLPRPPRELKGFAKVHLAPGESREVQVALGEESLSYYDPGRKTWIAEAGAFRLLVGTSSRAIAAELELEYTG